MHITLSSITWTLIRGADEGQLCIAQQHWKPTELKAKELEERELGDVLLMEMKKKISRIRCHLGVFAIFIEMTMNKHHASFM